MGSEQGWVGFSCLLELNHDPDQNWYDLYNKENFKIICINTNHSILSAEGFPGGSRKNSLYRQVFKYIFLFSNFWDTGLCLKQTLGLSVIKSYSAITCLIVQPVGCTQLAERNLYLSAYIRDIVLNQNLYNCCAIYCSLPIIMYILGYMPYIINSFDQKNKPLSLHISIEEIKVLIHLPRTEELEDAEKSIRSVHCYWIT